MVGTSSDRHHTGMQSERGADGLYRAMFERAPEATLVVDDDGRAILINAAARALSGIDAMRFFWSPVAGEATLVPFRATLRVAGRARHEAAYGGARLVFEGRALGPYYVIVIRESAADSGIRMRLRPDHVDVNSALLEAERLITLVAGPAIGVKLVVDARAGAVAVDGARLEHILLNLTASARAAMPRGGTLTISSASVPEGEGDADAQGRFVMLTVTDSGGGMTPEERERVFAGLLARGDAGQSSQLGLFVARRAVRLAGGCLSVKSAPAQGTSVIVYLPRAASHSEDTWPALARAAGGSARR
jgi:hypothetical protein